MNTFIRTLITFIFFTTLFYLASILVWGISAPSILKPNINYKIGAYGYMFTRLKDIKTTKNIDILFLGSSHTYRGFDTRIFKKHGFNTFNLGSSAQTPIQTTVLLKRYLKDINPKLIIYEVYPESFMSDGIESSLDIIANDKNDYHSLLMATKLNHLKTYNTLIYGTLRDLLNLNATFEEPLIQGPNTYVSGGFVEKEIKHYTPEKRSNKQSINLNGDQLSDFAELVNLIKERNIELKLVYAPITPSLYKSYLNNSEFDSLMSGYSTYYNFNELVQLNDSVHFYDESHLNQYGVDIFNEKLVEILKKTKLGLR